MSFKPATLFKPRVYHHPQLLRRLEISAAGVGYAVEKRESIVHENVYELIG
jgi:hypothetical protein